MRTRYIALCICIFVLGIASGRAATLIVTNTADSGAGSLRDTIAAAAAGDTIQFAAALNGQAITLTSDELLINKNITIDGPGAGQLTVKRSTAAGIPNFRLLRLTPSNTVTIQGLTLINGVAPSAASGSIGGSIYNAGSILTISNCVIGSNSADFGAGIFNSVDPTGGDPELTINNSTLSGNSASHSGGGIYNHGAGNSHFVAVVMTDSTISGNSATNGAGIYSDGTNFGSAVLLIDNCTISSNSASQKGGGIYNDGFGQSNNALVWMRNSTVSGNAAAAGGGVFNDGNSGIATLEVFYSTLSDNSAGQGGGILNSGFNQILNRGAILEIWNTVLKAGATGENILNDFGRVTSAGYNLSSDDGSGFLTAVGDYINTDPMLGPLQANGGPTFTHELLMGSPALNAGDPSLTAPPDFDQRGSGFPRVFNTRIDIGAFELQAFAPIPTPSPTPPASPTPTATASATPTHSPTPTATATATPAHTPTPIATATATPTATPTVTATTTPIATPAPTASATSTPTPTPFAPTRLQNVSTRLRVLTGDNALIGGFIVAGNASKRVIVRAIGPSLTNFGVPGALADPVLELHGPGGFVTITNDNWRDAQPTEIEATGLAPSNDLESAIVALLPPGNYTAVVRGNNNGTGVGLVEAYDLESGADAQLANISTRGLVDLGDNVMIGGFILGNGSANPRVLIRAIGPSLAAFGVANALANPTLELHNNNGDIIAANDDWKDAQQPEIEATGLPPSDDRESALVQNLAPGTYTATVRGKDNTTGVALVEAYRLADPSTPTPTPTLTPTPTPTPIPTPTPAPSPTPPARIVSMTSRAVVGTGEGIVLNAFIVTGPGPKNIIIRGLGPSLPVAGRLADPALDLHSSDGTLILSNDNWRDDPVQAAQVFASGLAPTNDLESAMAATLNPGSYTVVLRGVLNATGLGINELYDVSVSSPSSVTGMGTRASVSAGGDLLVSGIIIQQAGSIVVRVLGPSMAAAGVANVLANPTLELRDGNGALLAANNDWQDDPAQAAAMTANGLAPVNTLESAIVVTLPSGAYTAIAAGLNNGTGIGYTQFYRLPHSGPQLELTP